MAFCIQCGNPLSEDARFCARCGTRVEPAAPTPMPEETSIQPLYTAEEPVFTPEVQPEPTPEVQPEPIPEATQAESVWQTPPEEPVYEGPIYADPPEPAYVPPVKPERKPLVSKKPLGIGKKILVIFLSILAFIFGTATVTALCLRFTVTADNVAAFIETVDFSEMEAATIITDANKEYTLTDWLGEQLKNKGIDCSALTDNDMEDFLDECVRPFVQDEAQEFAAALLTGTHDYKAFCSNKRYKKSTVRTVSAIEIQTDGSDLSITFRGNGFLYNMVRILTGTLLEVGLGQRKAEEMPGILTSLDRTQAGKTAPAQGLVLVQVEY